MLKFLLEKEFKQFFRNKIAPRIVFGLPIFMMAVFPWATNQEIKNVNLAVVNNNRESLYALQLTQKMVASGYFRLTSSPASYSEAMKEIERGTADIIVEIPESFEESLIKEGHAKIGISANSVNAIKGSLGSAYLQSIVSEFSFEKSQKTASPEFAAPQISLSSRFRFNPRLVYYAFMIPALMAMLLTILCGFLPALNIVGEKERGTIEQMNVTPVTKLNFILAKLIPYWLMGFFVMSICFLLAHFFYDLTPVGSFVTIYVAALIFILTMSSFGLVASNYSDTMQQALFVMYFFILIFLLMSGMLTPIDSMPDWAQWFATFNPLTYFIRIMRSVYLKGSGFVDLWQPFACLIGFATLAIWWAIVSYRKNN